MVLAYALSKAQGLISLLAKSFLWQTPHGMEDTESPLAAEEQQEPQQPGPQQPGPLSRELQACEASQAADKENQEPQQQQQFLASSACQPDAEEQQQPQRLQAPAATQAGAEKRRRAEARDHRFRFQIHCRCSPTHLNSESFLLVPTDSGAYLSARHFVCPRARHAELAAARISNLPLAEQWSTQLRLEDTRLRYLRRRLGQLDITRAYGLAPLVATAGAQVYTTTVGARTHAVKVAGSATALLHEYDTQNEVYLAMRRLWRLSRGTRRAGMPASEHRPVIPKATYLVSSKADETGRLGFVMDYMLPLRDPYRSFLARKYLHPDALAAIVEQPGWETLSLLPHMGETRPELDELSIRVRDRPVYLDTIYAELGARGVKSLASSMGATLAVLHWGCQSDAKGVKFQFGLTSRSHFAVWMYGFGDCANFSPGAGDLAMRLAKVACQSPFWPRPASAHGFGGEDEAPEYITLAWRAFAKTYLRTSRAIAEYMEPFGWMPELSLVNGGRLVIFTEVIQALKESWRLVPAGTQDPEGTQHWA